MRDVLIGAAVLGAGLGIWEFLIHVAGDPLADVHAYYDAATRLNAGQPLYPAGADPNAADFYRYPPLLAVALRPFVLLPFSAFALAWETGVFISLTLLLRRVGLGPRTLLAVGILGIPLGWALAIGQGQIPLTLLLAIARPWSIALAGQVKLFPALAAVYWLGRRDWRSLGRFAAWSAVLIVAQYLLEPSGSLAFLRVANLGEVGEVRNISPYVVSPVLWAVLVAIGIVIALRLAPTRWGWPAAVALATLATPRLLLYMLTGLLAALRRPGSMGGTEVGPPPGRPLGDV